MNLLHVTPTFYPATFWGGPIFSTKALCDGAAATSGVQVRVLTTDAAGLRPADRVRPAWQNFPLGYRATYTRRLAGNDIAPGLLARLLPAVAWADIVHLTATYNMPTLPTLLACRIMGRPVVWSPRGAIQARIEWVGAGSRGKLAFEQMARALAPRNTVLHVTAPIEAELTRRAMPGMDLAIIPNAIEIPEVPSDSVRSQPEEGPLRLLFLSRVHEKKGLDLLIAALPRLPGTHLTVCGEAAPHYLAALKSQVVQLDLTNRVTFAGHVDGAARNQAYCGADLFVLPSHSENFGNVIGEALAYGVPVVTTTATPWKAVESAGCGRIVSPDTDALVDAITELAHMDLAAMGRKGRAFVIDNFSPEHVSARMLTLYRERLENSA